VPRQPVAAPDRRLAASKAVTKIAKDLGPLDEVVRDSAGQEIIISYVTVPQCRVCKSGSVIVPDTNQTVRDHIEATYLACRGVRATLREVEHLNELLPDDKPITEESLSNHTKRHLPLEKRLMQEIAERRTTKNLFDAEGTYLTAEAFMEAVAVKAWQAITSGQVQVDVGTGMQAILALRALEDQAKGDQDISELEAKFDGMMAAVRQVVPPEMWGRVLEVWSGKVTEALAQGDSATEELMAEIEDAEVME
jgi:hypothetical protein